MGKARSDFVRGKDLSPQTQLQRLPPMEDSTQHQPNPSGFHRCRVCAKAVHTDEEESKVYYEGSYYVVCCPSCAEKFESNPQLYLVDDSP